MHQLASLQPAVDLVEMTGLICLQRRSIPSAFAESGTRLGGNPDGLMMARYLLMKAPSSWLMKGIQKANLPWMATRVVEMKSSPGLFRVAWTSCSNETDPWVSPQENP